MTKDEQSLSRHSLSKEKNVISSAPSSIDWMIRYGFGVLFVIVLWGVAYSFLSTVSQWVTYSGLGIARESSLGNAIEFFLYDTVKIYLLLVLMVYAVAWLRAALNVERVRDFLAGKNKGIGYLFGVTFGAVTPFCSCSSIPLFMGFSMARIPIGITMAFLITSPLINEVAVVLLWGLLGWKFTVCYVIVGMGAGIVGGMLMDTLRAERWLQPFLRDSINNSTVGQRDNALHLRMGMRERHDFALSETVSIFRRIWIWVLIGVGIGALLHGYVPEEWFTENLGAGQWWSVPIAVTVGIPLYSNVTGIVPIMESLLMKGLPVGTTLAFCMSTVAASLPEVLMLKQVMQWKLLALFLGILLVIFTLVGWFFNLVGPGIL